MKGSPKYIYINLTQLFIIYAVMGVAKAMYIK